VTKAGDHPKGANQGGDRAAGNGVGSVLARFDPEGKSFGPFKGDAQSAEQPVEHGEACAKVATKMVGIAGVVDLMVGRAGEDTSQLAGECDPDVQMLQVVGAIDVGQDDDVGAVKLKFVAGGAEQEAGNRGCGRHDQHHGIIENERINGMHAEDGERRQRLRGVVDAMELSQEPLAKPY
jgi:hypothetical protein